MDPFLEAEARKGAWTRAVLVRIDLPDQTICWTDGGVAVFDGQNYYSEHPVFGLLDAVAGLSSGVSGQTTRPTISVLPKDAEAAAKLGHPNIQGSRVRVWTGAIDRSTGGLIGNPTLRFDGEIDRPRFTVGKTWGLTLQCGTQAERQLEDNADWRLNHALHSKIWPGEMGLSNVTTAAAAARTMEWRT